MGQRLSNSQLAKLAADIKRIVSEGRQDELDLASLKAMYNRELHLRCEESILYFARRLIIPAANGPTLFGKCMAPFQRECFNELAPSLQAVREGTMPPSRRFWLERTKKASKDSDMAVCLLWLLAFPTRPLYMQVGAADRDQAGIVKKRIADILHYNPWLDEMVELVRHEVRSIDELATLDIVAADIAGSHGATPDVLVINELSHVTKWEFVENLLDNADGVPQGVVMLATNAGFKGTKAEILRTNALESDDWSVHLWQRPAPWLNQSDVDDAKRRNLPSRFNRLWWGKWVSGKGDALSEDDIDKCLSVHSGPVDRPEQGWQYIAGLDLGVSHDHSGLTVVGVNQMDQRIRVVQIHAWEPNPQTGKVDLIEVENACLVAHRMFNLSWLGYDEYQAVLMGQRMTRAGVPCFPVTFSGKHLHVMANTFKEAIENGKLEAYDDEEGRLRRDFGRFHIVEKSYGLRLEAVSDEYGHADVGTALLICLPRAVQMLQAFGERLQPEDDLVWNMDEELTQEDLAELDPEFRKLITDEDEDDRYRQRAGPDLVRMFGKDWFE